MDLPCPANLGDLCRAIDHYCERTGPGLWAEPVNALTNLAFPLGAPSSGRNGAARATAAS